MDVGVQGAAGAAEDAGDHGPEGGVGDDDSVAGLSVCRCVCVCVAEDGALCEWHREGGQEGPGDNLYKGGVCGGAGA